MYSSIQIKKKNAKIENIGHVFARNTSWKPIFYLFNYDASYQKFRRSLRIIILLIYRYSRNKKMIVLKLQCEICIFHHFQSFLFRILGIRILWPLRCSRIFSIFCVPLNRQSKVKTDNQNLFCNYSFPIEVGA